MKLLFVLLPVVLALPMIGHSDEIHLVCEAPSGGAKILPDEDDTLLNVALNQDADLHMNIWGKSEVKSRFDYEGRGLQAVYFRSSKPETSAQARDFSVQADATLTQPGGQGLIQFQGLNNPSLVRVYTCK